MRLVALAAGSLVAACAASPDAREARDFERMRQQQRYDAYESSRYFANGAVLQAPPAHTAPRHAATARADEADEADGVRQFAISCAICHGAAGFGGGVMAANLEKRPPSLRTAAIGALAPERILAVITDGFGQMPPYGWQLTPEQRRNVVAYVKTLPSAPMSASAIGDSLRAVYYHRVDSARAAGADADALARLSARKP
jgi:mono/diheme cytochrome c family protein